MTVFDINAGHAFTVVMNEAQRYHAREAHTKALDYAVTFAMATPRSGGYSHGAMLALAQLRQNSEIARWGEVL